VSDAAIRGVLFDSGDTLVGPRGGRWNPRFDFESVLSHHAPDALAHRSASAFAAGEHWLRSPEATSNRDDYHRVMLAELGVAHTDELLAELSAPLDVPVFEAFPEAPGVLGRLRAAGVKLAIVTNNWGTSESFLRLTTQVELGEFDACVVSAEVGCAKLDAGMYRLASDLLELRPDECLFVDDVSAFVAAALELGYHGIAISRAEPAQDLGVPSIRSLEEILPLVGLL
jgi:HAD superfamily hydrolase (TIGR01509 family)